MSELTIWKQLRAAGLTEAGTAGLMGNLKAESLLNSQIVETRSGITGSTYTQQVDSGARSKSAFAHDTYGYGLAQWTYYSRKEALYDYAKSKGTSIGDETMQVEFLLKEMGESYASLLSFLKTTADAYTATSRVCTEFERPAYNNISARYVYAQQIMTNCTGTAAQATVAQATTLAKYADLGTVKMPVLKQGDKGIAVGMMQYALQKHGISVTIDCDFGAGSLAALNSFKSVKGIANTGDLYGKVTPATWEALYA